MDITDIVEQLTDTSTSLTSILLKVKVFGVRLKNKMLIDWVTKEIEGYKSNDVLPEYRISKCNIYGNLTNGRWKLTNYLIPTDGLLPEIRDAVEKFKFYQGVSELEHLLSDKSTTVGIAIQSEILFYLTQNLQIHHGNPYAEIYSATRKIGTGAIDHALSMIRSNALNIMLEIEKEFGYKIDMAKLMARNNEVNQTIYKIMNYITTDGNDNTINTGNNTNLMGNGKS
ncbi:hypothetical protein B0A67_12570 [Flavobacterium aquidurense]|uniref:AbiTii domain-containing protein n=1 Tax=Flavobacterium aquidurense TaxID=362413 RepID=UPI000917DA30|nr:hypothetical protein [Flavobacterium aquidurense]OXA71102.1 hypothetical protein B0A67_12570 [Flavobacterium aquidurense]SHG64196.1 hypothetical protein SAMN05444481_10654 [Flavobacterium frigidimaris]